MTDEEFLEVTRRYNWSAGHPIPRDMWLEMLLPGLVALFGLDYANDKNKEQTKK